MRLPSPSRFVLFAATALISSSALAEVQLSVYGGSNWNFDSKVKTKRGAVNDSRTVSWDGKSFNAPSYWGARGTYWFEKQSPWGVALDFTHQKAYADIDFGADTVYDKLELTDGNNLITLNAMYRFQKPDQKWGFYVGGGPGIAVPHFELELDGDATSNTNEYQITGFAAQILAGAQYKFTQQIAGFTETKLSYTRIDGEINGGGSTKTNIWSPHLLAGVSYTF